MPYISVQTSQAVSAGTQEQLIARFGKGIEILPEKTEQWLMVDIKENQTLAFAGESGNTAFVQVMLYGDNTSEIYALFTAKATEIVSELLSISPDRIYVAYFPTPYWGWNGENF
ncbi:MAG: hypothetical protein LBN36_09195 [Clostridiales Family XIII bacterium]|jgi:phenylpyruvate tautomerase PptA (4-oxalocrotonate tautomerase family)|nr:hypothetical protein [Clostridiales Family XIII bacterium]